MSFMDKLSAMFGGKQPECTSAQAKERLMVVISHQRGQDRKPDFLPQLQAELMQLLAKYMPIEQIDANVQFAHQDGADLIKVDIVMPGA
ncbi:cell division topological specificity factor MinE [Comamonas thiooxydans]|uniref:cell division topological specificity factor MinE n=1 Tax=Comamonas thiooxydans TaxID=363952 RepID=UPI000B41EAD3|nr:cell division topological specificity factor MinE [Comamonas thiooxydans]